MGDPGRAGGPTRIDYLACEIRAQGGEADAVVLDVTDRAAVVGAFAAGLERCDVLVNNAGGAFGGETVAEGHLADWQAMFDVNVLGTLHVTQALLPEAHRQRRWHDRGDLVLHDLLRRAPGGGRWRPSTPSTRSRGPCAWNGMTSRSRPSRSRRAWSAPTSSPG